MIGLPARGYESEATLGRHLTSAFRDLKAKGQIISFVHIPNEGKRSHGERKKQGQEGLIRGASDYDLKLDWRLYVVASLAIEVKTIKGTLSKEQARYLQTVHRPEAGHQAVVIQETTGRECVERLHMILDSLKRKEATHEASNSI